MDSPGFLMDSIRNLFASIDAPIYALISYIYQIFFNIANATLISGEIIKQFFSRIQLILGIVILFKLAISLIGGIINPDSMTDSKGGFSKIVTRIITALIMLVLIVPLNIPTDAIEAGSYESQLNNNGILFGTLYEFQSRVLSQNTLAKLILGENTNMSEQATNNTMADAGRNLAATILRTFIQINLTDVAREDNGDPTVTTNQMCGEEGKEFVDLYLESDDADPRFLLNLVNSSCDNGYVFDYSFFLSTVVGIVFVVIMLGFTLDMAIRAFKLAILRLIAPIPIISYIDPKASQSGAFSAWTKTVTTTYIDLFIRVAVLYFVIFVIQAFNETGIVIDVKSGPIWWFSLVFIILGLFFFAKEAPKFITDSLGIKSDGGFFKGVGRMLGLGATAFGAAGAAAVSFRAAKAEQAELHPDEVDANGNVIKSHKLRRGLMTALSTGSGALGGVVAGTRGVVDAKDHHMAAAFKALNQRNTLRAAHSTLPGRIADNASSLFTGQSRAAHDEMILKANKDAFESLKSYKQTLQEEARKQSDLVGSYQWKDANGNVTRSAAFNYERLVAAMNSKDNSGNFTYDGTTYNVSEFDQNVMNKILDSQSEAFRANAFADGFNDSKYAKLQTQWRNTQHAVRDANIDFSGSYEDIGKSIGKATSAMADMNADMEHIMHRANQQANKNK